MHKVLILILLLSVFISPTSQAFAKPNPFPHCTNEKIQPGSEANRTDPNECPDRSICYITITREGNTTNECHLAGNSNTADVIAQRNSSGTAKAGLATVAPVDNTCPENTTAICPSGATPKGRQCEAFAALVTPTSCQSSTTIEDPCKNKDSKDCTSAKGIPCGIVSGTVGNYESPGGGIMTAIGCIPTEPRALIEGLLWYGTVAAGGIAFLLMLLAAFQMITSEGNPQAIKEGQEKFYSAIIGLLFIIFAVLLLQVIGVDILGLQGFTR